MKPPIAKRIPHAHELHGDVREDDYYWLKDRTNPEVIEYVEDENRYYDEIMHPLKEQTEQIYQSMVDRVPDSEVERAGAAWTLLLLFPFGQKEAISNLCTQEGGKS